jgi:hypothetical protein
VLEGRWSDVGSLSVPDRGIGRILEKQKQLRFLTDPTLNGQIQDVGRHRNVRYYGDLAIWADWIAPSTMTLLGDPAL